MISQKWPAEKVALFERRYEDTMICLMRSIQYGCMKTTKRRTGKSVMCEIIFQIYLSCG